MKKILLLGSGELGKEVTIAAQRLGMEVVAVDSYAGAPAMQVADAFEVINMLDGSALDAVIARHQPDYIVPEIEAIATERLYEYEKQGFHVVPSARAANFTMNRKAIRDLAAGTLGLRTAPYRYADSESSLRAKAGELGYPVVVKPLMSSSGKGQSVVRGPDDVAAAWQAASSNARAAGTEVIVEGFVEFDLEITLLTVTQWTGPTLFCPPIGHVQERGDYQYSWQPAALSEAQLEEARAMADKVTRSLGGAGIWGVEFFVARDGGIVFSELSPRPHDTGLVTLSGSQTYSEFELHLRAFTGLPIPEIALVRPGASAVVLAGADASGPPAIAGIEEVLADAHAQVFVFGKPVKKPYRRMGVVVAWESPESDPATVEQLAQKACDRARSLAGKVHVA